MAADEEQEVPVFVVRIVHARVEKRGESSGAKLMNTKRTTALCVRTLPSTVCNLQTLPPFSVPTAPNSDEVEDRLRGAFPHVPTPSQDGLIHALGRFLVSTQPRCCLVVRGYAGTGKTTTMAALVQVLRDLRRPVELLAPTGRAAQVMGRYAGLQASTIHRRIYLRKATPDGGTSASIAPYARKGAVFIVDEASMIGRDSGLRQTGAAGAGFGQRDLLSDLFQFCLQAPGSRIILVGDDAQLPPVGSAISPALDGPRLAREFDLTLAERSLDDVVRQELDSGILANAHALRQDIALAKDLPEDVKAPLPQFSTEAFSDLHIVTGNDLAELLDDLHHRHGDQDVVIITRSNKRANDFNEQIRRRILWREEELDAGDRLMVVRNNYHWLKDEDAYPTDLIANGDTLVVQKIVRRYERYGLRYATADLKMEDFPNAPSFEASIMLDALHVDGPSLPGARMKALFEDVMLDHAHLGSKRKIAEAAKQDPCTQALQVKFAYAVTAHKSQGGQWPAIVVDQGYLTEEMVDLEWLRWLYTALTRAQEEAHLLNFHPRFLASPNDE